MLFNISPSLQSRASGPADSSLEHRGQMVDMCEKNTKHIFISSTFITHPVQPLNTLENILVGNANTTLCQHLEDPPVCI